MRWCQRVESVQTYFVSSKNVILIEHSKESHPFKRHEDWRILFFKIILIAAHSILSEFKNWIFWETEYSINQICHSLKFNNFLELPATEYTSLAAVFPWVFHLGLLNFNQNFPFLRIQYKWEFECMSNAKNLHKSQSSIASPVPFIGFTRTIYLLWKFTYLKLKFDVNIRESNRVVYYYHYYCII